jgi:hypothetical protein
MKPEVGTGPLFFNALFILVCCFTFKDLPFFIFESFFPNGARHHADVRIFAICLF